MARAFLKFCDGLLSAFVALVLLVAGCYAGYALWDNQQIYAAVDNAQADLLRVKQEAGEDRGKLFEDMRAINPDVRAWLTLDNTMIDYPVVQGPNNYAYLNTDVYGNFALAGSIFADSRCDPDFRDGYTLVHGHHMAERKMFGDLDLYKDKTFFEENRTGSLILEDRAYSLLTIACLVVAANDSIIFRPDYWRDDIEEPLRCARSLAMHYDDVQIERLLAQNEAAKTGARPPQILVLATCSSEYDDARTVLLAEMIEVQPEEEKEEEI